MKKKNLKQNKINKIKVTDITLSAEKRINLAFKKYFVIRQKWLSVFSFALVVILAAFSIGFAQAPTTDENSNNNSPEEERLILEKQLLELEKQISEYEKTITEYRKKGDTLKSEIKRLEAEINKLNLQIKAINLNIQELDKEIKITQGKINNTENKIEKHKKSLTEAIRIIYDSDQQSLIEIIIANNRLSDFFGSINNLLLVQENMRVALNEVINLRNRLLEQKQELSLQLEDTENLKAYQLAQKQKVQSIQNEKSNILKVTQGKESEYQKLLQKTRETAAEIRKRIFRLLGGGELSFGEAYQYARLAEKATGVRAALILAVLDRESLFGKNVGQCTYNQKTRYADTAMNPKEIPIFLEIIENLKNNGVHPPEPIVVSCPNQDGTYGGAMGPAQFIPSTWKLYEKKITEITGNKPPSPWNNADAFTATALYLKEAMESSSCKNYSQQIPNQKQKLLEQCAAAKYYAGSRWYTYRFVYGEPVVSKANKFEQDIEIINS